MKMRFPWSTAGIVLAVIGSSGRLPAQSEPSVNTRHSRVPVTIAIAEGFPHPDVPYVIYRTPGRVRQDVILLRGDADAQTVSEAVRTLLLTRRQGGDLSSSPSLLRSRRSKDGPGGSVPLPWAPRVLDTLHAANVGEIQGIGSVRAVEIWLPRQNGSGPPD